MENSGREKVATRPIPLAILGLMVAVLALIYQLNTIYYLQPTDLAYVLWAIGFFIVAWATWVALPEPSEQKKQ